MHSILNHQPQSPRIGDISYHIGGCLGHVWWFDMLWWWWSRNLMSCIRIKPVLRRSHRPRPRQIMSCHTGDSADAQSSFLIQWHYADARQTSRFEVLGYPPFPKSQYRERIKGNWLVHVLTCLIFIWMYSLRFYKENDLILKKISKRNILGCLRPNHATT